MSMDEYPKWLALAGWGKKDLSVEWLQVVLGGDPCTFYLPTETVILEPKIVVPDVGRYWETRKFLFGNRVVDYKKLQELHESAIPERGEWCGYSGYPSVYLIEDYQNAGDDGHTRYERVGYILTWGARRLDYFTDYSGNYPKRMEMRAEFEKEGAPAWDKLPEIKNAVRPVRPD